MKKRDHLRAIVARGYCHPLNSGKALDSDLLEAIVDELMLATPEPLCPCTVSDAWKCAWNRGLTGQIACTCACHKPSTPAVADAPEWWPRWTPEWTAKEREAIAVEPECKRCHQTMLIRDGEEPTEVCDHCAHEMLSAISELWDAYVKLECSCDGPEYICYFHRIIDEFQRKQMAAAPQSTPAPAPNNEDLCKPQCYQDSGMPAVHAPECKNQGNPGIRVRLGTPAPASAKPPADEAKCNICGNKFGVASSNLANVRMDLPYGGNGKTRPYCISCVAKVSRAFLAVADAPDMRKLQKRAEKWLHAHSFTNYWSMELAEEFVAVAKSLAAASTPAQGEEK